LFDEGFDKEVLMERKYRALRTIAVIFKVLGWVMLILGILSACGTSGMIAIGGASVPLIEGPGRQAGSEAALIGVVAAIVIFIVMLVTVGLYALILIAASEAIYVFLDIEENTRKMAMQLGRMGGPAGPSPPA
jgi:hypothetical protein